MIKLEVCAITYSIMARPGKMRHSQIFPSIKLCKVQRKGSDKGIANFQANRVGILVTGSLNLGATLSYKRVKSEMANLETLAPH